MTKAETFFGCVIVCAVAAIIITAITVCGLSDRVETTAAIASCTAKGGTVQLAHSDVLCYR